jgi:signal transduction histidine kinase
MIRRETGRHGWWLTLGLLACGVWPGRGVEAYLPVAGDPLVESWRWTTYPELSGLAAQCMTEGSDGKMWFGTVSGLWCCDGIEWVNYPPARFANDNDVVSLVPAPDGGVYIGARYGISQFHNGTGTRLFPVGGGRFGEVRKVATGLAGELWAATTWGALRWRNSRWRLYTGPEIAARLATNNPTRAWLDVELFPASVLAKGRTNLPATSRCDLTEVCVDPGGRVWFGTAGGEVLRHDPAALADATNAGPVRPAAEWTLFNELDGIIRGRSPSLLPFPDGSLWLLYGAESGYLNRFDGVRWEAIRRANAGLPEDCTHPVRTRDGVVWLSGRYVIHACRDGRWRSYQKPEFPIPTARNFLFQSADGALWIAGSGTEIQRVDYQTPRWLTLADLNFQWESPSGTQWFLHRSGRVVVRDGDQWLSYGGEDGVPDAPVALIAATNGDIWVAGSHGHTAATARWDGAKWTRYVHEELSWGIDWRGALAASDGSVWFSAAVDTGGPRQHRAGILQFRNGQWRHHHQPGRAPRDRDDSDPATLLPATQRPEPIGKFLCVGESADGRIWAGRNLLAFQDGRRWRLYVPPPELPVGILETLFTTADRQLWVGTRQFGALRYDGREWRRFQGKDSLAANSVRSLAQSPDGSIWAATDRDISRFDGHTWSAEVLPAAWNVPQEGGSLKASPSGAVWMNRFAPEWNRRAWPKAQHVDTTNCEFWTVSHQCRGVPPETAIVSGPTTVSRPGNVSVFWSGTVPWRDRKNAPLQFSHRLDGAPWSPFTSESGQAFFTLPGGRHRLEVRARDRDFNVDPTPAVLEFQVLPPVWRQGWFVALVLILAGGVGVQSLRVIRERGLLRQANRELASEIEERARAEQTVTRLNAELAERVRQRTSALEQVSQELRENQGALMNLVEDLNEKTAALQAANKELEAFSYSVSHDLRAPLRGIDGFSQALLEDYHGKLDDDGRHYLQRIRSGAQRMGQLIDDMLKLSRVTRGEMRVEPVNLSALAQEIAGELVHHEPGRRAACTIAPEIVASGDARLLRIMLENLLGNAWKFTAKQPEAQIEFGRTQQDGKAVYFVRDNGAGFDMTYASRLFGAFQRLHTSEEFPGTGIGLATVQRIVHRHGGRIWAESEVGAGATFFFTLQ